MCQAAPLTEPRSPTLATSLASPCQQAVVYWKIVDPVLARYAVKELNEAIQNLVLTQLRSEIGKLTLDETFSA